MFLHQDWLMRQIERLTIAIAQLIFGKGSKEYDLKEELGTKQTAILQRTLCELLANGRLGKAEDLLFSSLDPSDQTSLAVALNFYQQANELSDAALERQGFTREELWEGLGEAVKLYGIYLPGFWD